MSLRSHWHDQETLGASYPSTSIEYIVKAFLFLLCSSGFPLSFFSWCLFVTASLSLSHLFVMSFATWIPLNRYLGNMQECPAPASWSSLFHFLIFRYNRRTSSRRSNLLKSHWTSEEKKRFSGNSCEEKTEMKSNLLWEKICFRWIPLEMILRVNVIIDSDKDFIKECHRTKDLKSIFFTLKTLVEYFDKFLSSLCLFENRTIWSSLSLDRKLRRKEKLSIFLHVHRFSRLSLCLHLRLCHHTHHSLVQKE